MRVKRIIVGILIGVAIGAALESLNIFFAFLLPPFLVLLPLAVLIGGVGALMKGTQDARFLGETQNLEHLPAGIVEFIRRVLKKMGYRRKVRQDVQAELTAHFEDEFKDCKTDEEKEQKAQQLITDFGDLKLLAILLRRAKKRCRPIWRTVVARTFQALGMLILCFILYIFWFLSGRPVITTNYVAELNSMVRPVADESLNAAPLYRKAIDLYKELSDDFLLFFAQNQKAIVDKEFTRFADLSSKIDRVLSNRERRNFQEERKDVQDEVYGALSRFLGKKYNELTVEQRNIAKRWVQEHNDALELIIEGSQRPYYWRTYESNDESLGEMMGVLMPNLSDFRRLAFSLRLRIWLNAEQGRFKDAFDDAKSCYRFGQQIRGDKTLIEQLVGIGIEALAVRTIRDIVGGYEIDSTILADLQDSFEQIVAGENFVPSLEAEKLCVYDEIQRCFTEDRFGGGHLYLSRLGTLENDFQIGVEEIVVETIFSPRGWPRAVEVLFAHPDKEQTREMADRYYDFWNKSYRKTPGQIRAEGIDAEKEAMEIIKGNVFLQIFAPALARINEIAHRNKIEVYATVTILALLRYEKDKGSYPNDLQQLITAGYLKQLPMDSFADKPLSYRKTEDNFILYSVGPNFTDEGGEYSRDSKGRIKNWLDNGDAVFWPVPKSLVKK
ncbi:MAG TPA: hypothetical protein VMW72_06335 [Sedimentisphaerales bacterium]|nr:hypothetical protein [Sedimentisphaerales bacterium]